MNSVGPSHSASSVDVAESLRFLGRTPRTITGANVVGGHFRARGWVRTAICAEGDNRSAHALLDDARHGEAIIIYSPSKDIAVWGGLMAHEAAHKGVQAVVIDGMIRDIAAIEESVPTFFKGTALLSGTHSSDVRVDEPVSVYGVAANPGDWLVADQDGIVLVEPDVVEQVGQAASEREQFEKKIVERLDAGHGLLGLLDHKGDR